MQSNMSPKAADVVAAPIICPEPGCTRQFQRKSALSEHMKSHTGERPHVCPVRTCGKRFTTSGNLSRHKRTHGYIEPLQCPVQGCVCTFPSNNKLEKHMKFHYGEATRICSVVGCGKTFSTTGNLNRHLKNYHGHQEQEELNLKDVRVSVSSPVSGDHLFVTPEEDVDMMTMDMFAPFNSMDADFFLPRGDELDEIWSPAVLDTLQIILGDDSSSF